MGTKLTREEVEEIIKAAREQDERPELREVDLGGVNLREADLRGANLERADLSRADLTGADLVRVNLRDANLSGADLCIADLRAAHLCRTDLKRVNASGAVLIAAYLVGANLEAANLRAANVALASLRGADLMGADLRGANLGGALLEGASLIRVNLGAANLGGTDLSGANLCRANLHDADLNGANLDRADLSGADLRGANLHQADLSTADLSDALLEGANLIATDLRAVNRSDADLKATNLDRDLVGRTLGKYNIVARLGRGRMAEVYKAYQAGRRQYVAIKVLHSHLADDEDFIWRFEREATATASLRHLNIVQVVDFDVEGGLYYMAMELVEGPTLQAEIKERNRKGRVLGVPEATRIITALAGAIDYAHSRGMVHRDLKPADIMFTPEGQVVLIDFGNARIVGATHDTMTGAISGTPSYMSPELGLRGQGDERSDIYSLGVVLYETVTGQVPFDADTPSAITMKHINQPLPRPSAINPDVPEAVEGVICKALSTNPDDRYQTAGEMAQALREAIGMTAEQILAEMPIQTITSTPSGKETIGVTAGQTHTQTPIPTITPVTPVIRIFIVLVGAIIGAIVGAVARLAGAPTSAISGAMIGAVIGLIGIGVTSRLWRKR